LATNLRLQPRAVLIKRERVEKRHHDRTAANPPQLSQRTAARFGIIEVMKESNARNALELIVVKPGREHVTDFELHIGGLRAELLSILAIIVPSATKHRFRYIGARDIVAAAHKNPGHPTRSARQIEHPAAGRN